MQHEGGGSHQNREYDQSAYDSLPMQTALNFCVPPGEEADRGWRAVKEEALSPEIQAALQRLRLQSKKNKHNKGEQL